MSRPYMAECLVRDCEWSEIDPSEQTAQILTVLHTVTKHPDEYQRTTGKDPEKIKFIYREHINAMKERL